MGWIFSYSCATGRFYSVFKTGQRSEINELSLLFGMIGLFRGFLSLDSFFKSGTCCCCCCCLAEEAFQNSILLAIFLENFLSNSMRKFYRLILVSSLNSSNLVNNYKKPSEYLVFICSKSCGMAPFLTSYLLISQIMESTGCNKAASNTHIPKLKTST